MGLPVAIIIGLALTYLAAGFRWPTPIFCGLCGFTALLCCIRIYQVIGPAASGPHDIRWAIERLQAGKAVKRAGWNVGWRIETRDSQLALLRFGDHHGKWEPGVAELAATDWEEAETR